MRPLFVGALRYAEIFQIKNLIVALPTMLFRKGQQRARTIGTHSSCFVGCLWAPLYVIYVLHRRMIGCMPTIQHRQGMRQCEASMRLEKKGLRKVINKNIGVTEEPHTNSSIRLLKYRHRFFQ